MKIIINNYTFNAAAKTITFNAYGSILLDDVLIITNVTDNVIIYQFSSPLKGGTVVGNVLTLTYDTTLMSNTDDLQIWFYDENAVKNVSAAQSGIWNINNISGAVSLPTGAATAANQQTDALTDAELRATPVPIIGAVLTGGLTDAELRATPVPVSATNLDIRDLIFATDKVDISGSTLGANSGVDIGDVTVNNAAGAAAVNVQDGGNSLTIDSPGIPITLGQGTMATSMKVVIASDQSTISTTEVRTAAGTVTSVASSATDVTILAGNGGRKGAIIFNDSTQNLYILLSSVTSSVTVFTDIIPPFTGYEVPFNFTGLIKGFWFSANGFARVTQFL